MKAFAFVLLATVLEAVGDAVMRIGLHTHVLPYRVLLLVSGGALLAMYGASLNLAPVEFATVTGMYIACLFVVFQIVNFAVFHVLPTAGVVTGGALIVAGGCIVYFWR
jgi:hypothetical protein